LFQSSNQRAGEFIVSSGRRIVLNKGMQLERKNCWEVMQCGRQPGGENVHDLGVCIAALPGQYDGINKGQHGGRFCWVITGTLCKGEVQGTYGKKIKSCLDCRFFKQVVEEEGRFFILTPSDAKDNFKRVV